MLAASRCRPAAAPACRPPPRQRTRPARTVAAVAPGKKEAAALPHYAHSDLDRSSAARKDPVAATLLARPDAAAFLVTPRGEALVVGQAPGGIAPAYTSLADATAAVAAAAAGAAAAGVAGTPPQPILLGVRPGTGAPVYAVVAPTADPALAAAAGTGGGDARWESVVSVAGPGAVGPAAAVLALAAGLAAFQDSARFDAETGAPLASAEAGHAKRPLAAPAAPSGGGASPPPARRVRATRPRVDPAVLVLVTASPPTSPPFALLGRKRAWPPRRYSLLAGFVELGEALEGAAVREVAEESGVAVEVGSLQYRGSQPWPFPRSLMVAFEGRAVGVGQREEEEDRGQAAAAALDGDLAGPAAAAAAAARAADAALSALPAAAPLDGELADVRWFPLGAVADAVEKGGASGLAVPGPHALANSVLRGWVERMERREAGKPATTLPPVNPSATAAEGGARRPYILACVAGSAASPPHLIVRAAAVESHAALVEAVTAEAAASGVPGGGGGGVEVLGGGWLDLGPPPAPPAARTALTVGGPVPEGCGVGIPRHALAACVLRVALPLHEVEVEG